MRGAANAAEDDATDQRNVVCVFSRRSRDDEPAITPMLPVIGFQEYDVPSSAEKRRLWAYRNE
jgi:hypothetical protein